jgi:hypothetical protein
MFKDFGNHIAWTDTMEDAQGFVGLIEYQAKQCGAQMRVLWVVSPGCVCANEAECLADNMLQEITDISLDNQIIYSDGVVL